MPAHKTTPPPSSGDPPGATSGSSQLQHGQGSNLPGRSSAGGSTPHQPATGAPSSAPATAATTPTAAAGAINALAASAAALAGPTPVVGSPPSLSKPTASEISAASLPQPTAATGAGLGGGGDAGGNGGGNHTSTDSLQHAGSAGSVQQRYSKRSSDSGGAALNSSLLTSPPAPKGASSSGAAPQPSAPSASHGSAGRGRLQQLGQKLNLGLGLGRKKHATFALGVHGGSGALSGPEEAGQSISTAVGGTAATSIGFPSIASLVPSVVAGGGGSGAGGGGGSGAGGGGGGGGGGGAAHGGALGTSAHGSGNGGSATKGAVEEFNPPNHPVNPFSYLATPFRVMAKTKAGVAMGKYATTALRLKRDGVPPASYMWLWLGNFKRWHRRYFVASEAPGVLLIYKRANMKGKVWSTSLCDAIVVQDDSHPRQIRLVTPAGTIFLRVLRPEERQPWINCLRESIAAYRKHKEVVDTLTAAAAAAGEGGEAAGAAGALPSLSSGAVDQDMEQRRRIRARLNDRLAELAPLVSEVERHLNTVGQLLAGVASGVGHLSFPLMQHSGSVSQALSNRAVRGSIGSFTPIADQAAAAAAAAGAAAGHGSSPLTAGAHTAAAAAAAEQPPPASPVLLAVPADLGRSGSSPGSGQHVPAAAPARRDYLAAVTGGVAESEGAPERVIRSRSRSRAAQAQGLGSGSSPSLTAAVAALVDAIRATLHNDAVRITTLEAENTALNKTLNILRANTHRSATRSRGISTPGHNAAATSGAGVARASVAAAAAAAAAGGAAAAVADDVASDGGSACTADEDAFDVVEPFDDGVDYSILDDDAPHLHHRLGVDDYEAPYVQHGNYPGGADEEEESDEDAEEDAAELAQQAEVLNALEVVRQVEYITANDTAAQLKLLAAGTPPPPDAEEEEEEGGKRKHKSRGKGEDTDATLDDEDDYDSEAAVSGGGAGPDARQARRPYEGRSRLPAPKPLGRGFSIWSILKNMIGRDLTKITMPATINEPLSMTQRMSEVLENRALLERACTTADSVDRLMLVSCWLAAGYNSQPLRDNKPFNPLLGETFEWQAPDGSARYLCEQVSHHPPVSCFVAEGAGPQGYELYGEVETKTKFWGKTIDCILAGHMSIRLKAFGEEYRCNLGTLVINDIILGRFWIDLSCDMKIRNSQTGDTARLLIKPCRGYPYLKERGKLEGVVCDGDGKEVWRISGSSMSSLHAALTPEAAAARGGGASTEPQLVWNKEPELPNPTEQYCMTRFAVGLNDPADPIVPHLPPTDARFRPDMRALELGEWNRATSEKLRLEEKQRTARRLRKEAGQEHQARWFRQVLFNTKEMTQVANQPGSVWEFTGEYWDAREKKAWGELPDIY